MSEWVATIAGPEGSVYEGGTFFMDVTFPDHYPYTAPRVSVSAVILQIVTMLKPVCIFLVFNRYDQTRKCL